ncbi:hypothetical protein ACAH01_13385 [Halomicrobium sp. HM KBTZ05]|uniref:hypothetical protein n=1 Tax=Halomicrobium sp. HM KBTZ05 TaxID=3242663 RepID=UPI003556AE6A
MASENNEIAALADDLLQRPLSAVCDTAETVHHVLTNRRVGLTRGGDETTVIEPGTAYGAVAAITDRRLLFLVGVPPDQETDFRAEVAYDDVETVEKRTETLTQSLVVETGTDRFEFTARKPRAVDAAVDVLESTLAEHVLDRASAHHESAREATEPADSATELEAALDAYRRAATLLGDEDEPVSDAERAAREDAETVLARLVAAHREHAAACADAADWELAADNDESAYELLVDAREAYDRALELARAYPPGDPDAIERERAAVVESLEPLKVRFAVANA